jgi:hypothetical protein
MQRNVNKTGICGIAMQVRAHATCLHWHHAVLTLSPFSQASYPVKAKGPAPPLPPTLPPTPAPTFKCGCTASCEKTASAFGMECCCGDDGNCHISQHVEGCCAPCKSSPAFPFA